MDSLELEKMKLLDRKRKEAKLTAIICLIGILIYPFFYLAFDISFSWIPIGVLVTYIGLVILNFYFVKYRIHKGYYGTNEFEWREFFEFILRNPRK